MVFTHYYNFTAFSNPLLIAISGAIVIVLILITYHYVASSRFEITLLALLLIRIGFNFIALPERHAVSRSVKQMEQADTVGSLARGHSLLLADFAPCSHESGFYISRSYGKIVHRDFNEQKSGNYYIISGVNKVKENEEILYRFETRWQNSPLRLSLIK